jgi:integration host factor subunit alpha
MAKKMKKAIKRAGPKKAAKKAVKTVIQKVIVTKPAPKGPKVRVASRPKSTTMSYTQSEFIENMRAFCGFIKRSEAKEVAEDIASLIKDTLKRGYKIPFFGLGKLYVRQSKARVGRNPQTGESINIPARKRVRFTAAKALKEAVL